MKSWRNSSAALRGRAWAWMVVACFTAVPAAYSQAKQTPARRGQDVIILVDNERLVGQLLTSTGHSVTFKSAILGKVTVPWSKIKELHSSEPFAVVPKSVKLPLHKSTPNIPQGTLDVANQTIRIHPGGGGPPRAMPVGNAAYLIDAAALQEALFQNPGVFEKWAGTVTAGASLVAATQNNRDFNIAVSFGRRVPSEDWLKPRNRTTFEFSASYGKLTEPNTPTIKTSIYHALVQRDEYFTSHLYAFGESAYDHNFSQGLDLQQEYGGGVGWTLISNPNETLDLKGNLSYVRQSFQISANNQSLIGSTVSQRYRRTLPHQFLLRQQISVTPTWNNLKAYSADGSASLTAPIYKSLGFTIGLLDTFLNNPPAGFKKNSLEFTTGLTYKLQ